MRHNSKLYGILFMLLNTLSLACLDICSSSLRKFDIPSAQIVFLYKTSLLVIILPWVLSKGLAGLKTAKIHVHFLRSFFSVLGSICFITGFKYMNMADAAALENIQYVLLVVFGMIFFKEKFARTKVISVMLGFLGALVVVKPELFWPAASHHSNAASVQGYWFTLLAIAFWTINTIIIKILGKTEKNKAQMFYLMLFACIWAVPFTFIKFENINLIGIDFPIIPVGLLSITDFAIKPEHIKYIAIMAACYFIHGIAYFNALKHEMSTVVPFRYTKLLFSGALGYAFFTEVPSHSSYLGYFMIVASGWMLLRYEIRQSKKWRNLNANS